MIAVAGTTSFGGMQVAEPTTVPPTLAAPELQAIAEVVQEQKRTPPPDFLAVDKEPALIHRVDPRYPDLARRAGIQGKVYTKAWVDTSGRVVDAQVVKSDDTILNAAALEAVRQWRFTPAQIAGTAVDAWVVVPFHFRLSRDKEPPATGEAVWLKAVREALRSGTMTESLRPYIGPEAYIVDGTRHVLLSDALAGKSGSDMFRQERERRVEFERVHVNADTSGAFTLTKTSTKQGSQPWWHTTVWEKTSTGSWKIVHWHVSR
jgi:TonB family protein